MIAPFGIDEILNLTRLSKAHPGVPPIPYSFRIKKSTELPLDTFGLSCDIHESSDG